MLVFSMMTVFMFALAIPYNHWTHPDNHIRFVVLYSLTFFFANFGPNTTTFFVPAEIFPARLQSTCHGISAAFGKLGAMVGAFGFLYLAQPQDKTKADAGYPAGIGVSNSLFVLVVVNLLGTLCTFLVPESKGKSLEEKSKENDDSDEAGAEVDNHSSDTRTLPVKQLLFSLFSLFHVLPRFLQECVSKTCVIAAVRQFHPSFILVVIYGLVIYFYGILL
ncbi:inorganic phosphate transporter 1-4-like [Capsicum annuum]